MKITRAQLRQIILEELESMNEEQQIGDSLKGKIAKYGGEMKPEVDGTRIVAFPSKKEAMQAYAIMYETAQTMGLRFTIPKMQPVDSYHLKLSQT